MNTMRLASATALLFFVPFALEAQDEIPTAVTVQNRSGDLPFSASVGTDIEHVDAVSGNLIVEIPIAQVPSRGMNYAFSLRYDARWLMAAQRGAFHVWNAEHRLYVPDNGFGWQTNQPYITYFDTSDHPGSGTPCPTMLGQPHPAKIKTVNNFIFTDSNSSKHPLMINLEDGGACIPAGYVVSNTAGPDTGGSGIWAKETPLFQGAPIVFMPDGTQINGGSCNISLLDGRLCSYTNALDVHGNQNSFGPGAADTVGRVNVTQTNGTSSISYSVYDADGNPQSYTAVFASFPISTNFAVNDLGNHPITEFVGARSAITSLVLPDTTSYQFTYDNFGGLTQLTLPTGGTINYTWATFSSNESSYRYVSSRTFTSMNPVTGQNVTSQWLFQRLPGSTEVIVTDPAGNATDYTISNSAIVEAKVYAGAVVGTPLRDYTIAYAADLNSGEYQSPVSITTRLDNGLVSKKEFDYDSFTFTQTTCNDQVTCINTGSADPPSTFTESRGNAKAIREYDFGSGTAGNLLRVTTNHYLHEPADNPSTASQYAAANIVGKIIQQTITSTSGGTAAADTKYQYDNVTTVGPFLGDATAVKHWRNTDGAWLTTAYTYNSYGSITSMTDPKLNVTTWSYNDLFSSSGSHCLPSSANANSLYVSLMTNANGQQTQLTRSPCTGQVKKHQNQNDLNAGGQGMVYDFDLMNRPLSVADPLGGRISYSYPDANTVIQSQAITSLMNNVHASKRDAFGRATQTQHTTPSGPPATVDTGYDSMGHPANVTNPYFTASDATYGITTSFFDEMGRMSKVQKQDGSIASSSYTGNCATISDETGKPRRSCTDALGRIIEVDEPDAGFVGAPAQARIDIGPIKTTQVGAHTATQATGSVSITGTEQFKVVNTTYCAVFGTRGQCLDWETDSTTIFDTGTVTLTTNGHADQTTFGSGDTVGAIANRLASVIRSNSPYVDYTTISVNLGASPPIATINLISRSAGSTFNYSISTARTFDSSDFTTASFNTSTSAGALSGGTDAFAGTPAADHGTLTISAGSFTTPSISYGAGTPNPTATSVATALAAALNLPGSGLTTSTNGATGLILTATTSGVSGNSISVNTHPTSADPTNFPSPSFAVSSVTLSGGLDPDPAGTSLPLITLYQYDVLDNLLCVEQHGGVAGTGCADPPASDSNSPWRVRRFTYDSLSHLTSSSNPEANSSWNGTSYVRVPSTYQYDNDGNLSQKTSPAPNQMGTLTQTITFCYDQLNRLTGKAYSAQNCQQMQLPTGTAVVSYVYDVGANNIGHLTSVTDQAGSASYGYDLMGRLKTETRILTGASNLPVSKSLAYDYNLDGSLKTLQYPSGAIVTYAIDAAGRVGAAIDNGNNIKYVTGSQPGNLVSYGPDGSLTNFISGATASFAGITSSYSFNKRLQPVNMSAASPTQTVYSITYDFHVGDGTVGADNGNLFTIYNNRDHDRDQTFTYDSLNRLTSAQNAGMDCSQLTVNGRTKYWGNNYGSDPWGNLTTKAVSKCQAEHLYVTAKVTNQILGYGYDTSGNMTSDPTDNLTPVYDQENRLSGGGAYTYIYDLDGNRVEKKIIPTLPALPTVGTLYWYMTPGVVAETDLTGTTKSEYIFFDGKRVARRDGSAGTGGVFYYFSDHLKTASVITNATGTPMADSDYYPWGGELQFVNNDSNDYKFTGKKRDDETGLDYFGARYYSNGLGRFMTSDWSAKVTAVPYANFADPQSLNLYSYVRNIPTVNVDPDGHNWFTDELKKAVIGTLKGLGFVTLAPAPLAPEGRTRTHTMAERVKEETEKQASRITPPEIVRPHGVTQTVFFGLTVGTILLSDTEPEVEAAGALARQALVSAAKEDAVIAETLAAKGNITSSLTLTAEEALGAGKKFVGTGYTEVGKSGSGVFRSTDGLRQFRMDSSSLEGSHAPGIPHVHFEVFEPGAKYPTVNNHVPFTQ